ncbi:serine/threonine-protein kinase [Kutzneria sp. CA-103260]|uniref:serine/threonine-protein kinase n=1 Tax=Kutzneria sp. CA-103260 TaxID=2802641 RepID=UPI001BA89CA4|nr:serine/threonine-protein kinase [Kutzneria sp. CA-103260]QUQ63191.1 serine/threonine protein kinase [Kutzneria sp. CA-103260]
MNMVQALPQCQVGPAIGAGRTGVVYAGVHRSLGPVAIKRLPGIGDRFDREAKILAGLDHPHIAPVHDYVRAGRDGLLVTERLDGGTVFERFRRDGITPDAACAIALATLAGLRAAHRAGVLHLDVRPKNLLFTGQGVLKVVDFGLAQGPPAYTAPERATGGPLTPAADVYSTGTVLYELLSGTLPDRDAATTLRQRGVPEPLARVVMRARARETSSRYPDTEAFATELTAAADATFGHGWQQRSGVPVHLASESAEPVSAGQPGLVPTLIAAISLLALVVLAFVAPAPGPRTAVTQMAVVGVGPGQPANVDLSLPVPITGGPATMSLSLAGIPITSAAGQNSVTFPAITRWLVGGTVTGRLQSPAGIQEFPAVAQQFPLASAMGLGSLLACVFSVLYLRFLLRTVRRGQEQTGTFIGAGAVGALFGVGAWLLISVLTGNEPSPLYGIGCAVAGVVAAVATMRATSARSRRDARAPQDSVQLPS